jgi:hypothetical protein
MGRHAGTARVLSPPAQKRVVADPVHGGLLQFLSDTPGERGDVVGVEPNSARRHVRRTTAARSVRTTRCDRLVTEGPVPTENLGPTRDLTGYPRGALLE